MGAPDYESHRVASDYLLFHYGSAADQLPWPDGPVDALEFPARCAALVLRHAAPDLRERALDLGCATGRATFELARGFASVTGVDYSKTLIDSANAMRVAGRLQVTRVDEGDVLTPVFVHVPPDIDRTRVEFRHGDACDPSPAGPPYDAVLMANLICRLHDPGLCLQGAPARVKPGGVLVITTPCSWMEEFTPREKWIGGIESDGRPVSTLDGLRARLSADFDLVETTDLPFLIREHARKHQWSMAQASVWRRRP